MFGLCAINVEKTEHRNMQSGSLAQGIYTAFRKTSQFANLFSGITPIESLRILTKISVNIAETAHSISLKITCLFVQYSLLTTI